MLMKKMFLAAIGLVALTAPGLYAQQLAFPGAVGFGRFATGGRGGAVVYVSNTNDSGSGSFRSAVGSSHSIVLFSVGGTISLASPVSCASSLSIEGQTAPGGGIAIIGHEVSFSARSNEIVRNVRFRPGSIAASTEDGINFGDGTNMIFDHISIEFAPYNNVDASGSASDANIITVQNSMLAYPIGQQFNAHTDSANNPNDFCWWNDIFDSGHNRNPLAKADTIYINNTIYNFQGGYTVADTSGDFDHDIVNNYFIEGPATTSAGDDFYQMDSGQSVYSSGNLEDTAKDGVLTGSSTTPSGVTVLNSPWSSLTPTISTLAPASSVLQNISLSGALPHDDVDTLVQAEILSFGTSGMGGGLWTSQTQTGLGNDGYGTIIGGTAPALDPDGLPNYFEVALGLSTSGSNADVVASSGYTYVEEYANWLSGPHLFMTNGIAGQLSLSQYTDGFQSSPTYTVSGAVDGTVSVNGSTATFTANSGFSGLASFNFTVTDSSGDSMTQPVSVLVMPRSSSSLPANGIYRLLNQHNGLALDAFAKGTTNGTPIDQWAWNSGSNQEWALTNIGSGVYTIVGLQSGLYVYAPSTGQGTFTELYQKNSATSQEWTIQAASGNPGYFTLTGVQSGRNLDDYDDATTNGTRVDIWSANGDADQNWLIEAP